jgi:hypothetical protein
VLTLARCTAVRVRAVVVHAVFIVELAAEKVVGRGGPPGVEAAYGNPEHMFVGYEVPRTERRGRDDPP